MGAIVIAEDDPDIRSLIADKLSDSGHRVTATGDGAAALLAVRRELPDVVVLDMQMPGLSGLDVVRLLRVDPLTASVPVIMVTSHDQPNYVGESFLSGADDFLAKPFSPRELTERVTQLLESGRSTTHAAPVEEVAPRPAARPAPKPAPKDEQGAPKDERVGRRGFLGFLGRPDK